MKNFTEFSRNSVNSQNFHGISEIDGGRLHSGLADRPSCCTSGPNVCAAFPHVQVALTVKFSRFSRNSVKKFTEFSRNFVNFPEIMQNIQNGPIGFDVLATVDVSGIDSELCQTV